ncbi:MAG: hypothetical protein N2205_06665 [Candidatus Caldatribacterium sp.]|nr:hypothetical protein [Candidatus Caldatribacterium sp.]MDW8081238.1 hypothetical protein [Candidatus Calescibacterium sp.]
MGTFLRVVGIVAMCFGIAFAALVLLGMWNWMEALNQSTTPFPGVLWTGSFGGVLGGFGIFVGGASLFCLGTIYNDVKALRGR